MRQDSVSVCNHIVGSRLVEIKRPSLVKGRISCFTVYEWEDLKERRLPPGHYRSHCVRFFRRPSETFFYEEKLPFSLSYFFRDTKDGNQDWNLRQHIPAPRTFKTPCDVTRDYGPKEPGPLCGYDVSDRRKHHLLRETGSRSRSCLRHERCGSGPGTLEGQPL